MGWSQGSLDAMLSHAPLGGGGLCDVDVQVQRQGVLRVCRQRGVDQLLGMARALP